MGDAEVKDSLAGLDPQVLAKLHVAAPLPGLRAGCGPCVHPCGREVQGQIPSSRAPWLHLSEMYTCLCGRRESPQACFWHPQLTRSWTQRARSICRIFATLSGRWETVLDRRYPVDGRPSWKYPLMGSRADQAHTKQFSRTTVFVCNPLWI
jgi:hypothetical protein